MIERLVVAGGRVLTLGGWDEGDVVVERGRIVSASGRARRPGANRLDASGLLVVPGFVDVQINGAFGNDFTADPESIWRVGARLPASGVTAFLPTLVSPRAEEVEAAIGVLAAGPPSGYAGAVPLGLHCEGPMLSPRRRGVHRASRLRAPSAAVIRGWSRERGIALVTLAPELRGASAVTRTLLRRGVIVAAGHSDATYEQATRAFARGVGAGTHLFNAMSGLHHRSPGLAGALLAAADVPAGLIADGIHVHAAAVELAWRAKGGPAGIVLVSDAAPTAGAPRSRGAPTDGVARGGRGVIAGSLIMLDRAVRNVVSFTGCDPAEALRSASASPARLLGDRRRGEIRAGARADLTLLDEGLRVAGAVVGGVIALDPATRRNEGAIARTTRGV